jgi:hypothetical protein
VGFDQIEVGLEGRKIDAGAVATLIVTWTRGNRSVQKNNGNMDRITYVPLGMLPHAMTNTTRA